MSKEKRTPNKKGEFLLDVTPVNDSETLWTIYDISTFLPHWEGMDRARYKSRITHTIKGNNFIVYIIDSYNSLTSDMARRLAKEWYLGNTTYYRLD